MQNQIKYPARTQKESGLMAIVNPIKNTRDINKLYQNIQKISLEEIIKNPNKKEYEKLKAAYLKDPVGFSKTQFGF